MEIPEKIKNEAKFLIEEFGDNIEFEGKFHNRYVFQYILPNNTRSGFPIVYLYDPHTDEVEPIGGMKTFDILDNLE